MDAVLDVGEALRYLGAGDHPPEELRARAARAAEGLMKAVPPQSVWKAFPLERGPDGMRLSGTELFLPGSTAGTMLAECGQAVLLACTLGARFDALLRAAQARDMAEAVILDACGSAWVEAGCGAVEQEIADRFPDRYRTDRFSPGYGDLPLSVQSAVCGLLDARRRLGVFVTDSFLLNPAKTVTAVVGLSDRPQRARIRGCAFCALRERCTLRKGGSRCGL